MLFGGMSKMATAATTFTPAERDYVRRELDMFFSTYPTEAEGFQLKTWRGGPQAGQPKLPPPAHRLLERGLMRLDMQGIFVNDPEHLGGATAKNSTMKTNITRRSNAEQMLS